MDFWLRDIRERRIISDGSNKKSDLKHEIEKSEDFSLDKSVDPANAGNTVDSKKIVTVRNESGLRSLSRENLAKNVELTQQILKILSLFVMLIVLIFLFSMFILKARVERLENTVAELQLIIRTNSYQSGAANGGGVGNASEL